MLKIIKYVKYIAYGSSDSKIFKTVCCKGASLDLKKKQNLSFLYLHAEILKRDLQASQKTSLKNWMPN